jgi:putative hydrolase of the HAD superfamily
VSAQGDKQAREEVAPPRATLHPVPVIRALFLDAAGTLIEPCESVAGAYARHASAQGLHLEPDKIKAAFADLFSGTGDPEWAAHPEGDAAEREWWRQLVAATLVRAAGSELDPDLLEACFRGLFAHYADPAAWHVFPEVPQVLADARAAGLQLAVVSNFDRRLHGILAGHGLHFDVVITSADARARKPDPSIFRAALTLLDLQPEEVLHAGDSPTADLQGAALAGIAARLVKRPDQDLRPILAEALAPG